MKEYDTIKKVSFEIRKDIFDMFARKNGTEAAASEKKKEAPKYTWQQNVTLYLHDIVYMLAVVMLLLMLFVRIIVVDGPSMENTLLNGDYMLLVSNLFYKNPQYGDVVVISKQAYDNGKPIVKRIIATEGQEVDIDFDAGVVYVDGVALEEPYTKTLTTLKEGNTFPQTVEPGCVFVMGDNRNNSKDSRSLQIGQVDKRELLGKVFFILFPGTGMGGSQERDFHRIGAVK